MSGFIGAALHTNLVSADDTRLNRPDFWPERLFADVYAIASAPFENIWWPRGSTCCLGMAEGILDAVWWGEYDQAAGASSRYGFVGVTRNQYGSPVGTCVVKLFRTSDDLLLDTTTSDPSGNFLLNTAYYPDAHYITLHKSGSPDIDGITVNTLIGT